ncbi:MAG: hypothetical protein ACI8XV_001146 [Arenicella sp.]|jgi:hypothetical protein
MTGTLTDLKVAGKLAVRAMGARLRSELEPTPDLVKFKQGMQALIDSAKADLIKETQWVSMPATQAPWIDSQIQLKSGEQVSYFVEGRTYVSQFLDVWIHPSLQLWSKVGNDGEVFRGSRKGHSFTAKNDGQLQFGNYFPNDWADRQGNRLQSDEVYAQASGELCVLVIHWNDKALDGLKELVNAGDYQAKLQNEIERIEQGDITPVGWNYLWNIGTSEIYSDQHTKTEQPTDHQHSIDCQTIHCHTSGDTGILQHDVDMALTKNTEISWRWCIDQLPSSIREDSLPSHDYLSIAVEFDTGRDITYYWSSTLSVGTGFDCPLPNWAGKEYHVVVRSGGENLGQWLQERRNLYADHEQYMGKPPARIVRVWLIANSILQRGTGTCDYADIVLSNDETKVRIL